MISYYELLGMIKEGKAPKKIRVYLTPTTSKEYIRENDLDGTFSYYGLSKKENENEEYHYYLADCLLESSMLDKNIEILGEEKKIPEKIPKEIIVGKKQPTHRIKKIEKKINEIISYLDYLQSKGDE